MKNKKSLWGIVCLALAVIVFLNAIGLFKVSFIPGVSTMKLIITVIVAYILLKSLIKFSYEGIIICCGILLKMYEGLLGISIKVPLLILVMILLILACEFIFSSGNNMRFEFDTEKREVHSVDEEEGYLRIKNHFGEITKYVNSEEFNAAIIDNAFGEVAFYLNNAVVKDGKATVNVVSRFGEVNIYIPKNWLVKNDVKSVFGDMNEGPMMLGDGETPEVELVIKGRSRFGEINIIRM